MDDLFSLQIRPDYDTDVLWKPPRLSSRSRTISTDSQDSDDAGRRMSFGEDGPLVSSSCFKKRFKWRKEDVSD